MSEEFLWMQDYGTDGQIDGTHHRWV